MKAGFQIGGFKFMIVCPDVLPFPANMQEFQIPLEDNMYTYHIELTEYFPEPEYKLVTDKGNLQVYDDHGLEVRYLRLNGKNELYGYYREISDHEAEILFHQDFLGYYALDPVFVSLLALEKHVLPLGGLVLHCAYIERNNKAILFSAPSETGKTTQANLWKQYRGTPTINGDRALLRKIDGIWNACGWPVCGTSGICHNKNLPIEAIVVLSQAEENTICLLRGMFAYSPIYSQIMINRWNRDSHQWAMNLIDDLLADIPVYHLGCTISKEAVECLENELQLNIDV